MTFSNKAENLRRKRREQGPWDAEKEAEWLADHPEDAGTPHWTPREGPEAGGASPGSDPTGSGSGAATAPLPATTDDTAFDADLIPDVEVDYEPRPEDIEVDRIVDTVGILDAYERWCGKSKPKATSRTEGIKVSCPSPTHPDKNPSAWINTEKETWFCGACQMGGDKYDIAAWNFGMDVPGYKKGASFPELKRKIAGDLGYVFHRTITGATVVTGGAEDAKSSEDPAEFSEDPAEPPPTPPIPAEPSSSDKDPAPDPKSDSSPVASVTALPSPDDPDEDFKASELDWRPLCPGGTFLHTWMQATMRDDLPEEYYLWLGLQAVGLAAGRTITLADQPRVNGNLYICLLGKSGVGKSRSIGVQVRLLREALPFNPSDDVPTGTMIVPSPGSAEALIDSFSKAITDPGTSEVIGYAPIRGLVRFDEFSALVDRSSRVGSAMKPTLMEFYDGYNTVELKSRGAGHVKAESPFAAIVTTSQPRAIGRLFVQTDIDSGFLNRWLFVSGREKERVAYGRDEINLDEAVKLLENVRGWAAMSKGTVDLSDGAFRRWSEFFHDVLAPAQSDDDGGLLTRVDLTMKKLMLLLAINSKSKTVDEEIVERVLRIWPYLASTYGVLSESVGVGINEEIRRTILESVNVYEEKYKKPPSVRDIHRTIRRRKYDLGDVIKVINFMVKMEQLVEVVPAAGTPGRPTVRYASVSD